ncbi:unnamed protein product [Rodentolepis nana]|uniref:BESS domain-containing protein n=1 Tax=Rodentolepis nana TaxID=102285 RepID=A0A0R3TRW3_RODNA|nr:unnamed protein product [Rodentolepis nana]
MKFAESSDLSTGPNSNSASPGKCNSDEGDDQRGSSQSTTPNSSLEANVPTDTSSLSNFKEASIKSSEGTSKSYSMEDILRSNPQSTPIKRGVDETISEEREMETNSTADEIMQFICSLGKHNEAEQEILRKEILKLLKTIENLKENPGIKAEPTGESNKASNEEAWKRCVLPTDNVILPPAFLPPAQRDMFGFFTNPRSLAESLESLLLKPFPNYYPPLNNVNEKIKQTPLSLLPPNISIPVEAMTTNQTEALSLVVDKDNSSHPSLLDSTQGFENSMLSPRKKRTKVTDTRLPPQKVASSNGINPLTLDDSPFQKSILGLPFNDNQKFMESLKNLLPLSLASPPNTVERSNIFNKTLPTPNHLFPLFHQPPFLPGNSQFPFPHNLCSESSPIPTSCSSGLSEPGPIRRNRSIGSRRVTNTASMLNYGGDARPYRIPTSITDDGTARLHSSMSTHPLPMVSANSLNENYENLKGVYAVCQK